MPQYYDILSENSDTTVVAHYDPEPVARETSYQGEEELEHELIEQLKLRISSRIPSNPH